MPGYANVSRNLRMTNHLKVRITKHKLLHKIDRYVFLFGFLFQGTGVGELRNPSDPAGQGLNEALSGQTNTTTTIIDDKEAVNRASGSNSLVRLKFRVSAVSRSVSLPDWDAMLWKKRLYVKVTAEQLAEGSKEAFVTLLEYAEEDLECTHVVVCLDQNVQGLKAIIRNFLFLGFQPLTAGHEFLPMNPNLVSMMWELAIELLAWMQCRISYCTRCQLKNVKSIPV